MEILAKTFGKNVSVIKPSSGELVGKKGKIFHEVGDFGWRRLGDSVRILRSAERLVSSFCCRAHTHTQTHTRAATHWACTLIHSFNDGNQKWRNKRQTHVRVRESSKNVWFHGNQPTSISLGGAEFIFVFLKKREISIKKR